MPDDDTSKTVLERMSERATKAAVPQEFNLQVELGQSGVDGFSCAIVLPLCGRTDSGAILPAGVDFITENRASVATEFRKSIAEAFGDEGILHSNLFGRRHMRVQDLLAPNEVTQDVRIARVLRKREALEILASQLVLDKGRVWRLSMDPVAVDAMLAGRMCSFRAWSDKATARFDFLVVPDSDKMWATSPIVDEVLVAERYLGAFLAQPLVPGQSGRPYKVQLSWQKVQELVDFSSVKVEIGEGRRLDILVAREPEALVRLGATAIQHMWVPDEFGQAVTFDDRVLLGGQLSQEQGVAVQRSEPEMQSFLPLALAVPWRFEVSIVSVDAYLTTRVMAEQTLLPAAPKKGDPHAKPSKPAAAEDIDDYDAEGAPSEASQERGVSLEKRSSSIRLGQQANPYQDASFRSVVRDQAASAVRKGIRAAVDRLVTDLGLCESMSGTCQLVAAGPAFTVEAADFSEGVDVIETFMSDAVNQFSGSVLTDKGGPAKSVTGVATVNIGASVVPDELAICALIENPVQTIDWRCVAIHEQLFRDRLMDHSLDGGFEDIEHLRNIYGVGTDLTLHSAFDDDMLAAKAARQDNDAAAVPLSDRCVQLLRHLNANRAFYGYEVFRAEPRATRIARINAMLVRKFGTHALGWCTGRILGRHGHMLVAELRTSRMVSGSKLLQGLQQGPLAEFKARRTFQISF